MLFILFPLIAAYGYITDMPGRDIIALTGLFAIAYLVSRILANLMFDADANAAHRENERKHMRSGFQGISYNSTTGKHVVRTNGDTRDHAQRCQDSLRDWYKIEQRLKWNNWIYVASICLIVMFLNWFMGTSA